MEEKENLIAQLKLCDGVILQGGAETDNYEIVIANIVMKTMFQYWVFVQGKIILQEL